MTDKNRQKGNESAGEKSDGLARDIEARDQLARCPFCGGAGEVVQQTRAKWNVVCDDCCAEISWCDGPKEAAMIWNTRSAVAIGNWEKPVAYYCVSDDGDWLYNGINEFPGGHKGQPLYGRPAPEALPVDSIRDVLQKMVDAKLEDAIGPNHLALCLKQMANEALDILKAKCRVCGHARHPGSSCVNVAPEALGAAQTWQPIETAPKDGTEILLYAPPTMYEGSSVSERVTAGKWHEWVETSAEYHATTGEYLGRYEQDSGAFWLSWDGGFTEEYPPTHWMPLPTPPATTAKDQS